MAVELGYHVTLKTDMRTGEKFISLAVLCELLLKERISLDEQPKTLDAKQYVEGLHERIQKMQLR